MGEEIVKNGTPKDFGPLVYAFTGSGNVSQVSHLLLIFRHTSKHPFFFFFMKGALEIFKEVPHEFVPAEDLAKLVNDKSK